MKYIENAQYVIRSMRSQLIKRNVNISTTSSSNNSLPELCDLQVQTICFVSQSVSQYSLHSKLQLNISLEVQELVSQFCSSAQIIILCYCTNSVFKLLFIIHLVKKYVYILFVIHRIHFRMKQ